MTQILNRRRSLLHAERAVPMGNGNVQATPLTQERLFSHASRLRFFRLSTPTAYL